MAVSLRLRREGVFEVKLDDPATRNAMSRTMAREFSDVVKELNNLTPSPRVVVVTGAGATFSSGGDTAMLLERLSASPADNETTMLSFYRSFLSVRSLPCPTVAAINGPAIGAAFALALGCDLRIAAASARIGLTFVRLGLFPGMGSTFFLRALVGSAIANDLLLTGRLLTAEQALAAGLVSSVAPDESFDDLVDDTVASLLAAAPKTSTSLVRALRADLESELDAALLREAGEQAISYADAEIIEGLAALREKRAPKWTL